MEAWDYSGLNPEAFIMGSHRALSSRMIFENSSGVVPVGSTPKSLILDATSGVLRASDTALLSVWITF